MKPQVFLSFFLLLLLFIIPGCKQAPLSSNPIPPNGKHILVTNSTFESALQEFPLPADLKITRLSEPGTCPGHYDILPSQALSIREASLILRFDFQSSLDPKIKTILMSCQHDPDFVESEFIDFIKNEIMIKVAKSFNLNTDFEVLINPTGRFVLGGPAGDTGLTGRKIIVDSYGGSARHGGGAFSGKDPSKVDRSAAYMARYIAKNLVAAGVADRLEIQLSYAIGKSEPLSISVSTFKTSHYSDETILTIIRKLFDCRPGAIIEYFKLREPSFSYRDVSNYGHFGRPDLNLSWEKLDKVEEIKKLLKELKAN